MGNPCDGQASHKRTCVFVGRGREGVKNAPGRSKPRQPEISAGVHILSLIAERKSSSSKLYQEAYTSLSANTSKEYRVSDSKSIGLILL